MRIEAVSVCVNYADFLEETLPHMMSQVDDLVVVSTPEDKRTKRLCDRQGVRCLQTRCFYQQGDKFNKARGINFGLANLTLSDWVLHVDADIVLPPNFRHMLTRTDLDPRKLYGCDRVNCLGREAWDHLKRSSAIQYEWSCMVLPPQQLNLGARIVHLDYGGYCPIGFFQLWNARQSGIARYPSHCQGTAEHSDVLHSLQWDRRDRVLIPEVIMIHLETKSKQSASMGANWFGRTTPEFTRLEEPFLTCDLPIASREGPNSAAQYLHPY